MKSHRISTLRGVSLCTAAMVAFTIYGMAQAPPVTAASSGDELRDLKDQVRELRSLVEQMRVENAESRNAMQELRQDLQATRALLEKPTGANPAVAGTATASQPPSPVSAPASAPAAAALEDRVQKLEDATSLLGSKVDEQYQTKVETASKYRARLHGIILMNAMRNVGGSDNLDFPNYAMPVPPGAPQANLTASLRQSEVGVEAFGPTVAGARSSADVQLDFAGGFPGTGNGVNFGIARLETASMRLDWEHTSIVAGQDSLFFSPLSPTSFASLATPAFAFAGNLWGWTPQLRLEHRFALSDEQTFTLQGGILDNLDWETPANSFYRYPQAGELSGQPAYALRTAWSRPIQSRPLSFGIAGYYGRQNWTWDRIVDAWAGMADWQIPIGPHLGLYGEFYRGRGIGGLGAAIGTSIVYGGNPAYGKTPIRGVDAAGGWTELKFQVTPKLEFNAAFSEDDALTGAIRGFASDANNGGPMGSILGRNRGALGNVVFRPRSDLILSAEFRRLRTFPVYSFSSLTNQSSISMGILF